MGIKGIGEKKAAAELRALVLQVVAEYLAGAFLSQRPAGRGSSIF
ncbi:MAG: hypothetical protein R3E96_06285 [Planctomycetota bacterium]